MQFNKDLIQKIDNDAVRLAQRKSLENSIPNSYSKNTIRKRVKT